MTYRSNGTTDTILVWNIFEIHSKQPLNGVMLRGRIRKFGIQNNIIVLAENTEDIKNSVRFAVTNNSDAIVISKYIKQLIDDVVIEGVLYDIPNPVLSKLKVNDETRYTL